MALLFEVLFGSLVAARPRKPRAPREVRYVEPNGWLTAASVATGAMALLVALAVLALGAGLVTALGDELLGFLAMILLPVLVGGMGIGIGMEIFLLRLWKKLRVCDRSARLDLVSVASLGLLTAVAPASVGLPLVGLLVALPAAVAGVVAGHPDAWREPEEADTIRWT